MDTLLEQLLDLLDEIPSDTVGTSLRIPLSLRDAAVVATDMGLAASTTELAVQGLRDALENFAQRAVLDAHYRAHPDARPSLAEVAQAAAELDGSALAAQPELIQRAAHEVAAIREAPSADDVLLYAAGLASAAA